MSEELIVRYCSPTLAGIKTGSLFSCSYSDISEMRNSLRYYNRLLGKKGLRVLPLYSRNNRALIYVYRPSMLITDLRDIGAMCILRERGYVGSTPVSFIARLKRRIADNGDFPHEIGLFLGYPVEDVHGFIENKAEGCKCVGCWKVYGDMEMAQKLFKKYKKCTEVYCSQYARGRSVEKLTVSV